MVSHVGRRCIRLIDELFTRFDIRVAPLCLRNDRFRRPAGVDIPDEGFGGNGLGFSAMSEFDEFATRPDAMTDAASPGGDRSAKVRSEPLPVRHWHPDGALLAEGITNQPIPPNAHLTVMP